MRRRSAIFVFALLIPMISSAAGESPVSGAKDLFYDPAQGSAVSVQVSAPKKPVPPPALVRVQPANSGRPTVMRSVPHHSVNPTQGSESAATQKNRGLHYWIELEEPGGEGYYVTNQYVFRSGQRIRLHFVSNTDGRILLIQTGASGTSTLLFPDPGKAMTDNRLKAGADRILPNESHWFRFDSNAGTERLVALFAGDDAELARFPVKPEMGPAETKALMQTVSHIQGSKDLVIETETRAASEVGTYGVNLKGEPVILEIVLQHR